MDLYISSLLLGATGLGVMALSGLGNRGHSNAQGHGHSAHGHAGGHGGHAHAGHLHAQGHAHSATGAHGSAHASHGGPNLLQAVSSKMFWTIMSPRFLFSFALGFGAAGQVFRSVLGGPALLAAAIGGAVVFERLLVSPLWNFAMRFASQPAVTLESAITDEATAVTSFDANGQGIVSLEVDGQVQQILATLKASDRLLPGTRVRAGQRLRVDEVDAERNRCTVTLL
jgi:hypothetical protein